MNKEEFIKRYGKAAHKKKLQQMQDWYARHRDEEIVKKKEWCQANPEKVKEHNQKICRKGGKYYEHMLKYQTTGLRGERHRVRMKHAKRYLPYKQIIAPDSQIHHEWVPGTANFRGVALVETDQHMHGYIDVIKILDGKITLLTEEEIEGVIV